MKKFKISKAANADLRKIAEYTRQHWGTKQRDIYIKEMFDAFSQLAKGPEMAVRMDSVRLGYRKFPQGSHVIFFREGESCNIEIIRVLHKRMDVDAHLNSP